METVLRSHDGVRDVAVIGVPHDIDGQVPRAYIVSNDQLTEDMIHEFIEAKVAKYKWLRKGGVEFVEELPRSAAGKLLRRELVNSYTAKR